jgi:hypothetical protein
MENEEIKDFKEKTKDEFKKVRTAIDELKIRVAELATEISAAKEGKKKDDDWF